MLFWKASPEVPVSVRHIGFPVFDKEWKLPAKTTLFAIEQRIASLYGGSVGDLTLWHNYVEPDCILRNRTMTLESVLSLSAQRREVAAVPKKTSRPASPSPTTYGPSKRVEQPCGKCGQQQSSLIIYYDFTSPAANSALTSRPPLGALQPLSA